MRAFTGGNRTARLERPKRLNSNGDSSAQHALLDMSPNASGTGSTSGTPAGSNSATIYQQGSMASSSSSTGTERDRWYLPRSLNRSNIRDNSEANAGVSSESSLDPWAASTSSLQAAASSSSSGVSDVKSRNGEALGFVVDRDRSTTTNERIANARKASLWRLRVNGAHDGKLDRDSPAEQRRSTCSFTSPPTSPTLLQQSVSVAPPNTSSPSPPSPFSHARSEQSPPTTPPDSVLSEHFTLHKRDLSWASSIHSPTTDKRLAAQNEELGQLPPPLAQGGGMIVASPQLPVTSTSRNDIFSAAQPILAPAPRISTNVERKPSTKSSAAQEASLASRQSNFFFSSPVHSEPVSPATFAKDARINAPGTAFVPTADGRPRCARTSTVDRERERQAIRQNNTEIDFRLCPSREFLLGEGRHSCVYLGSYRTKRSVSSDIAKNGSSTPENYDNDTETRDTDGEWQLCAIKRPFADHHSQLLALEEAFALRRLGPHPNVVRLIKIRDEVGLTVSSPLARSQEELWTGDDHTSDSTRAAMGVDKNGAKQQSLRRELLSSSAKPSMSNSQHSRSTSEASAAQQIDLAIDKKSDDFKSAHRRLASTPIHVMNSSDQPAIVETAPDDHCIGADSVRNSGMTSPTLKSEGQSLSSMASPPKANNEAPRILILLELLPHSLKTFTKRHSDQVDLTQWTEWAIELAGVVEWLHSRGCIHADLKPENILLTGDLHVKLCDFNSALFPNPSLPLTDGFGLGSPYYGAPELTHGPNSNMSKGFMFPVDIWSLGAILYSLATGQEPFKRARSMIDIHYRKRAFFETEENDRSARLSVAEGSSTAGPGSAYGGGSTTVSRHGSVRGRNSIVASSSPLGSPIAPKSWSLHQRAPSSESIESTYSGLGPTSYAGRMPSVRAIAMLLDESPPIGVMAATDHSPGKGEVVLHRVASDRRPSSQIHAHDGFASANLDKGHDRATSLSKPQSSSLLSPGSAQRRLRSGTLGEANVATDEDKSSLGGRTRAGTFGSPRSTLSQLNTEQSPQMTDMMKNNLLDSPSSRHLSTEILSRPYLPLRTASYGGASGAPGDGTGSRQHHARPLTRFDEVTHSTAPAVNGEEARYLQQMSMLKSQDESELRLAVNAAFSKLQNNVSSEQQAIEHRIADADREQSDSSIYWDDMQPYPDGYPALLLPGGGRLPNAARDLLKRMLSSNPDLRPTAAQLRMTLEAL